MKKGDRVFIHQDIPEFFKKKFSNNVGWLVRRVPFARTVWVVENIEGNATILLEDEFTLLD